jgi:hypothetical protein
VQAQLYIDMLDYVRISEEIKTLKGQAVVMQSLPEFRFSTNNSTTADYHSLIHNYNHLQGAQAELEALNQKLVLKIKQGRAMVY